MSTSAGVSYEESEIDPTVARSFVSRFLATRLEGGEPLTSPERHDLHAALLLTDIEGFTGHVDALGAQGAAGLERLAAELNAYSVTVVDTIRRYGGDVLAIAGDSFLGMWPAGRGADLTQAAAIAASAALAIQRRIGALGGDSSPASPAMPTRAGLSAGALTITFAGGFDGRWELVPSGPALAAVSRAERHGRTGAVTLGEDTAELLAGAETQPAAQGLCELTAMTELSPPAPLREPVPAPALVRPYVPLPVRAAGAVQSPWLAEFRPVTSVMVSLRDDGSDTEQVHLAVRRFQELMDRFGGASKLNIDNKGLTCSGLFGLPPRAHDDDVLRGLRTAQAAFAGLGELYVSRTVGVASGKVLCGMFGSDTRREYSLFGDAINIAARLSGLGEGAILVDDSTAHGSPLQLAGTPRPDLRVRGRRRPAEVMELTGIEAAAEGRSIVNRDRERGEILARMGDVLESGRSAVVLLSGEPGIGKSTVARQALSFAADSGMQVLEISADAVDRVTPYGPWRPLVAQLLGGAAGSDDELLARVGEAATDARLLPLLGTVLAGAPAENETTGTMAGDARREQTNELISRALATTAAVRPVALLVDDAQWLDSSSWSLLLRVAVAVPRMLLLVTQRKVGLGDAGALEREELLTVPGAVELEIRSLDAAETTTLIQHRLGVTSVPRAVLDLILDRVAGHPLFCESLVSAMVSSGTIRIGGDGAELMSGHDGVPRVEIPATIESAVLSRVDGLRPGHEMTLKAASVVGRVFSADEVTATHPNATRDEVSAHLDELQGLELIDAVGRDREAVYAFRHQIVRDVAYQLLTGAQRVPLHRSLADHLEALEQRQSAALLAHHWLEAGEPLRALPYLEQGGRDALREGAFAEAVRLLEAAIAQLGDVDPVRRALLEKSLADAHYFLGNMVGGRALLELSLERLGYPVAPTRVGSLRDFTRESAAQARRLLPVTAAPVDRERDEVLATAVEAHRVLVQISYLHAGSALELCTLTVAALNLAERLGASPELARALAHAAALASVFGMRPLADRYGERAIAMAAEEPNAAASAYVWNILGIMRAQRGEWGRAIDANERALELFGELGDYNFEAELWQTRSALELCRGSLDGAAAAWRRTQELAERTGSEVNRCWSLLDQTQTLLAQGETGPAAAALESALAIPTPGSDGGTVIERWATTAWTRLQQGRLAEAVAEADLVVSIAGRQLATGWIWAEMTAQAVDVLLSVRELPGSGVSPSTLDRKVARGLRVLARLTPTFAGARSRAHLLRARARLQQGDRSGAARALRRAERAIVVTSGPIDPARIALVRAQMTVSPRERRELLAPAIAGFTSLGRHAELAQAEALL